MSDSENLSDVHKIRSLLNQVESMEQFQTAFPLIKPFLESLGADTSSVEEAFGQMETLSRMVEELATVPDRFNDLLASRGWIMIERMDMQVARQAIEHAEAGDLEAADRTLVEYFDPEHVERELMTMRPIEAYRPRMHLTNLALEDYRAGRYHACIPVVLAQIDGLVSELHEQQRGFFAEDASMEAWDSLAAHSKGLNKLSSIFRKGRRKTTTDPIDVPYRNGILHGRDLGYANRKVAAKAWAALFAVREWALKVERDELEPPPPEHEMTLADTISSYAESKRETERWKTWAPREVDFRNVGHSPPADQFDESTPEYTLAEYLRWWSEENYGYMSRLVPKIFSVDPLEPIVLQMRRQYDPYRLVGYIFESIDHSVPAIAEITVDLKFETDQAVRKKSVVFRMTHEDEQGEMVAHGNPDGRWVVMNWNALPLPD